MTTPADRRLLLALLLSFASLAAWLWVDRPAAWFWEGYKAEYGAEAPLRRFFNLADTLGDSTWILITSGIAAAFLWWRRHPGRWREVATLLFLATAASGLLVNLLKILFGRARPRLLFREDVYGFFPFTVDADYSSFPSGHSTTAFTVAAVLALFWPRQAWLWATIAVLIAAGRVVMGSHYVSDTLAGALLGLATVWAGSALQKRRS